MIVRLNTKFNMKVLKLLLLFFPLSIHTSFAQESCKNPPATEIRAVWLTTNWGLDWPSQSSKTVNEQKRELENILDELERMHINTILFQTRARASAFYRSGIEPLNPNFNHTQNFDPLEFAVEECHKRGMECHAWFVTYPMDRAVMIRNRRGKETPKKEKRPDEFKLIGEIWHLDPGNPKTREYIIPVVKEIVSKYDVDGIHFDYIRYPNADKTFPDNETYKKYGKGMSLADWRRNNINKLVFEIYDTVKGIKNWVQVSSSPLGRYRVLPEISRNDGWTAYDVVYQDAGYWMRSGKHDLVFPMMYHRKKYFDPFLEDWIKNSNGRFVVPGLGISQLDEGWALGDITEQMLVARQSNAQGEAYFRVKNILTNTKGIRNAVEDFYPFPAKLPALTWLDSIAPPPPTGLQLYKDEKGELNVKWEPTTDEDVTYTVYYSDSAKFNFNDAKKILTTGRRARHISFHCPVGDFGLYYTVTASDRYHNESKPAFSGYFSHSENEQ